MSICDLVNEDIAMNHLTLRLAMRCAVPVIALGALAMTGQPNYPVAPGISSQMIQVEPCDTPADEGSRQQALGGDESEQRQRVALRLRWSLTLPAAPRLPGV